MGLIVQKFGGTSVANAQRINHVADIIANTYKAGNNVIVVLSAQGDTTDDLIEKANEINPMRPGANWICCFPRGSRFPCPVRHGAGEKRAASDFPGGLAGGESNQQHL